MIGNVFLPIVAKVLPYINAFVIALQRLFTWLAKILGIDLSGLLGQNTGFDNSGISDLLDEAEGLGDALDNDADSAKKLKKQLQGFDALNNLTSKEDSGKNAGAGLASGLLNDAFLDAVSDYLKVWQDGFDKLENNAQKIADRIQTFFVNLTAPIRRAWENVGESVVKSWKRVFKEAKGLSYDFWITFNRVWGNQKTQKVFENIFVTIGNIGEVVANLIGKFREAWSANDNGFKILSGIRDVYFEITEHIKEISESVKKWSENINLTPLLTSLANFMGKYSELISHLMDLLVDFIDEVLLPLGKWTLEEGLPKLLDVLSSFVDKINWDTLQSNLSELWKHLEPFMERVGEGLILFIEEVEDKLANWINDGGFEKFIDSVGRFLDSVSAQDIANVCDAIAKGFIAVKLALPVVGALKGLSTFIFNIKLLAGLKNLGATASGISSVSGALGGLGASISTTMMELGGSGVGGLAGIWEFLSMDAGALVSSGSVATVGATIGTALVGGIVSAIGGFELGKKLGALLFPDDAELYENFKFFGENGFVGFLREEFTGLPDFVNSAIESLNPLYKFFNDDFKDAVNNFGTNFKSELDKSVNSHVEFVNKVKTNFTNLKNTVLGETQSISTAMDSQTNTITTKTATFAKLITKPFESVQKNMPVIGSNLMIGFSNGLTPVMSQISAKVATFASGLTNKLRSTWQIHSPSRVMDDMGYFFMKGLQNGIEGMYTPIATSLAQFGNELTQAPNVAEEMADIEGNDFNVSSNQSQTFNADNSETNSLLRQQNSLLQQILEKEFGISEGSLFKSVQRSATDYRKMTGNPAF